MSHDNVVEDLQRARCSIGVLALVLALILVVCIATVLAVPDLPPAVHEALASLPSLPVSAVSVDIAQN